MPNSFTSVTDFIKIVAGVLQRYSSIPCLFIICQGYALQISIDLIKENGFYLKRSVVETMTYTDYQDDLALLQAESLLHR